MIIEAVRQLNKFLAAAHGASTGPTAHVEIVIECANDAAAIHLHEEIQREVVGGRLSEPPSPHEIIELMGVRIRIVAPGWES